MERWTVRLGISAAAAVLLAFPVAWWLDAGAIEVQKIRALDAQAVTANRLLYAPGDDVVEVYGARLGGPVRVLFIDESRIVRPDEEPSLALYPTGDEFVLQTRWVYYAAKMTALGAGAAVALLFSMAWWLRRRREADRAVKPAAAV